MKYFIFIILLLCSIHFWGLIFIPLEFYKISNSISLLILGISFLRVMQNEALKFKNSIIILFIGIVINIISAYVNQGQSPWQTFIGFGFFYFILMYFFLHEYQLKRKFLENIIIIFAVLYSLLYIFQVIVYPIQILHSTPSQNQGMLRLLIEGNGFLILAYLLMLNRYLLDFRLINILSALAFFILLLMGGFRTLTLAALLISSIMYFRITRFSMQSILVIGFIVVLFIGLFQFNFTSDIVNTMVDNSKKHLAQGDSYIRILQFKYFFNRYPVNRSVFLFGGGLPAGDGSYSWYMEFMAKQYGYYWVDLGIFGFFIIIGIVALLGILLYTIKAISAKVKLDCSYLNYYFAFLLITSFTTMEIYRPGIFGVEAIALYLIDLSASEVSYK